MLQSMESQRFGHKLTTTTTNKGKESERYTYVYTHTRITEPLTLLINYISVFKNEGKKAIYP